MTIESTKSAPAGSSVDARHDAATRPQQKLKGALILSLAVLVTGLQDAFIKDLSAAYPVWEMQIFRGGSAALLIFGWIVLGGGLRQLTGTRPSLLLLARSAILAMASLSFYVALAGMQFADAVAIYFSLPLMIAALSGFLIGEKVPPQRWVAIIVAFAGVAIIDQRHLQPGDADRLVLDAVLRGRLDADAAGRHAHSIRGHGPVAADGVRHDRRPARAGVRERRLPRPEPSQLQLPDPGLDHADAVAPAANADVRCGVRGRHHPLHGGLQGGGAELRGAVRVPEPDLCEPLGLPVVGRRAGPDHL